MSKAKFLCEGEIGQEGRREATAADRAEPLRRLRHGSEGRVFGGYRFGSVPAGSGSRREVRTHTQLAYGPAGVCILKRPGFGFLSTTISLHSRNTRSGHTAGHARNDAVGRHTHTHRQTQTCAAPTKVKK